MPGILGDYIGYYLGKKQREDEEHRRGHAFAVINAGKMADQAPEEMKADLSRYYMELATMPDRKFNADKYVQKMDEYVQKWNATQQQKQQQLQPYDRPMALPPGPPLEPPPQEVPSVRANIGGQQLESPALTLPGLAPPPPPPGANVLPGAAQLGVPREMRPEPAFFDVHGRDLERAKQMGIKDDPYAIAQIALGHPLTRPPAGSSRAREFDFLAPPGAGQVFVGNREAGTLSAPASGQYTVQARPSSASVRINSQDAMTLEQAKELEASGYQFKAEGGEMLDLNTIPKGMVVQAYNVGQDTFYRPRGQKDTHFVVGGRVYAVSPYKEQQLPEGAGVDLGASVVPRASTREALGYNPATNTFETFQLRGTSTPSTPGIAGRPAPLVAPPGAPTAPPAGQQQNTTGGRPINVIPATQLNRLTQRVTAVREAATQLLGDPQQPGFKGLKDYAHLADDPGSRERLRLALRVGLDAEREVAKQPGFMQLIRDYTGATAASRAASSNVRQQAIENLTPEERDFYDAAMSAYSTVVGIRSLTGASAAQFSVDALEREIPLIGINTSNSRQFYDQAGRLSEVIYNGTKNVPESMWENPELLKQIKAAPAEFARLKNAPPPPPPGGGTISVISPDGKRGNIPAANWPKAEKRGFKKR